MHYFKIASELHREGWFVFCDCFAIFAWGRDSLRSSGVCDVSGFDDGLLCNLIRSWRGHRRGQRPESLWKLQQLRWHYAEYNPDTRDVFLSATSALNTPREVLTGQRALFNLETKKCVASSFPASHFPLRFVHSACASLHARVSSPGRDSTTDDSSKLDFLTSGRKVFDLAQRPCTTGVIFSNSTVHIGQTPIFWFPGILCV